MKKIFIYAVVTMMCWGLAAQSVQESVAAIGDLSVPACNVSLQKDVKVVKGAMDQYMKDARLKTKNVEGYVAVIQQVVPAVTSAPISLYTKVEEQGKKKNGIVMVTVAVIGNDLTIDQAELRDNAKSWLADFVQYINRYEAMLQMNVEQQNLKKVEKIANTAADNLANIEKNIANDQKKISDKQKEIEKMKAKIKDYENDIKDLQNDIEKLTREREQAQQRVGETCMDVRNAENEVERYRKLSE